MLTFRNNSRDYSALFVIVVALADLIYVAIARPYRYGFVSCYKREGRPLFERIDF